MQQFQLENYPSRTFDEVSMESSKSFINALHELKSLRPQLYSAAEYCEKSYLNSEQKEIVLDNVKDYATRAFVNAVDHLGAVAYNLTDLFEQQTLDVSSMELKISCLNRELLTCQIYMNKEGPRQQQLLTVIPRHHKHYTLPNSVNKKVHFSPQIEMDARQKLLQAKPRIFPAETKSSFNGTQHHSTSTPGLKASGAIVGVFQLLDGEEAVSSNSTSHQYHSANGGPASNVGLQSFGVRWRDYSGGPKPITTYRSFDNAYRKSKRASVQLSYLDSYSLCTPASKTFSWHLAPETKSSFNWTQQRSVSTRDSKASRATAGVFQLLDGEEATSSNSSSHQNQSAARGPASTVALQSIGVTRRDYSGGPKSRTTYRSFDNAYRKIKRARVRSRRILSAFIAKQKTTKLKASSIPGYSFLIGKEMSGK